MKRRTGFILTLSVGVALGAGVIQGLHAQNQNKPAYLVAEVHVTDPAGFKAYQHKAFASLKPYHVRLLANAKPDVREGASSNGNIIIVQFASMADALKWYTTSPYKELIPLRQKAAETRLYFVEGVAAK